MASIPFNGEIAPSNDDSEMQDLSKMAEEMKLERNKLNEERKAFEEQKADWLAMESKLKTSHAVKPGILKVGGTTFSCSPEILQKVPDTYFAALVSGRWETNLQEDGSLFIDRDPTVFPLIMTYLRMYGTGFDLEEWRRTLSKREEMLLKEEAQFYLIPGLLTAVKQLAPQPTPILNGNILHPNHWSKLHTNAKDRRLLFESSQGNISFSTLKSNLAAKTNLLFIVQLFGGDVIGAFTSVGLDFVTRFWQTDSTAFIFYIPIGKPLAKYAIKNEKRALVISSSSPPSHSTEYVAFGDGHDLRLSITDQRVYCKPLSYEPLPVQLNGLFRSDLEIWTLS